MAPLHLAVESNHIKMVKCLIDQGADINIQDDNEVILHIKAVDYFELASGYCTHYSFPLLFGKKILSLQVLRSDWVLVNREMKQKENTHKLTIST